VKKIKYLGLIMAMVVGFSGASGSGKTTLVNAAAKRLRREGYNVGVVEEVAREVFKKYSELYGYGSLMEIRHSERVIGFQTDILVLQAEMECRAVKEYEIVLTDRTIYDNLFFTIYWGTKDERMVEYMKVFVDVEREVSYNIIFLCEPLWDVDVDDGFRTSDIVYRRVQHEIIKRLLPCYVEVPDTCLDERIDLCVKEILNNGCR